MKQQLQQVLELIVFGSDKPKRSRRTEIDAARGQSASIDNVDDITPSAIAQPSPILPKKNFKTDVASRSISSGGKDDSSELEKTSTWWTVSGLFKKNPSASWEPSFFQIRPLTGICALAIAISCVFGSLIVLVVSHNQPVDKWPIQPTVYLAIVAAVANSALALGLAQAIPVSWWYRASRGASIQALERHWHTTNTLGGALIYGKLSILTAACIATSFAIIDGPFLQQASKVRSATMTSTLSLNLNLLPELPTNFSGAYINHEIWYTKNAWATMKGWARDVPIPINAPGCVGLCKATVQAPGVVRQDCSSQTWPISPAMVHNASATWGTWSSTSPDPKIKNSTERNNPAFFVNLINGQVPGYPSGATREGAYLTVGLVHWMEYEGAYVETSCWLNSAVVEYDVVIEKNIIKFDEDSKQGRLVSLANNTTPAIIRNTDTVHRTTIDGFTEWLAVYVNANASVALNSNMGPEATFSYDLTTFNPVVARHMNLSIVDPTEVAFLDPTDDVIMKFNQLMFRGGVVATRPDEVRHAIDDGLSHNQTVRATQTIVQNVFKSDLRWFAGAAIVQLLTVVVVLPMFWGWWTLGENTFTLSPFTMALAFNSPLLEDVNSAAGAKGVMRKLGNMKLKFGWVHETEDSAQQEKASNSTANSTGHGRLGVAESGNVVRPRKGMTFSH